MVKSLDEKTHSKAFRETCLLNSWAVEASEKERAKKKERRGRAILCLYYRFEKKTHEGNVVQRAYYSLKNYLLINSGEFKKYCLF